MLSWSTADRGKFGPSNFHFEFAFAPSVVTNTPMSVATYTSSLARGSINTELTGVLGRLALTLSQLSPPFVVLNTCPDPNP